MTTQILIPLSSEMKQYVVVFRAPAAVLFETGQLLQVNFLKPDAPATVTIQSRYLPKGLQHPVPGDLWVDVRGYATNLEHAVTKFGEYAGTLLSILAFSTNAAIGDMDVALVFDNSQDVSEREFLQSFIPDEKGLTNVFRKADPTATAELTQIIGTHKEIDRIMRAITQYDLALGHWRLGREMLAMSHLYIGMEAITKAYTRYFVAKENLTEKNLPHALGIDPDKLGPNKSISREIDSAIRRNLLFRNDSVCYQQARSASDGFEHAFMPFDEIRQKAKSARNKTAEYLRDAILDIVTLSEATQKNIKKHNEPLGYWPLVNYVRGMLITNGTELAPEGNAYPIIETDMTAKSFYLDTDDHYKAEFDVKITPKIAEGAQFQLKSYEVWRP